MYDGWITLPQGLVVETGANIGYFSLFAASMGHRVLAFEPMDFNLRYVHQRANQAIHVFF
jgi:hypothetical protein